MARMRHNIWGWRVLAAAASKIAVPLVNWYWRFFGKAGSGVRCILVRNGQVLLVQHSYRQLGLWCLPSGNRKNGEDFEETARREVWEELRIKIDKIEELESEERKTKKEIGVLKTFVASPEDDYSNADGLEIIEAKWFLLDSLPENIGPVSRTLLNKYKTRLQNL